MAKLDDDLDGGQKGAHQAFVYLGIQPRQERRQKLRQALGQSLSNSR